MVEEIHKSDIGTKFLLTVKDGTTAVDISGATTKQILFTKPSGEVVTQTAIFNSDGTDGKIYYITVADDIDETGLWQIQSKIIIAAGTFKSNIEEFRVYENL